MSKVPAMEVVISLQEYFSQPGLPYRIVFGVELIKPAMPKGYVFMSHIAKIGTYVATM